QSVAGCGIAVQVIPPALYRCGNEGAYQLGLLAGKTLRGLDQRPVTVVSGISQKQHHRVDALLPDQERLAAEIALLDGILVDQERCDGERVRPDLVVGVAEARFQEQPGTDASVAADPDRVALESREAVVVAARMGDKDLWVLL